MTARQTPAPAASPKRTPLPQPGRDQTPAEGAPSESSAPPAGTSSSEDRTAQRDQWRRVQASYKRGQRGDRWRRQAARGTVPARAGMNRRPAVTDRKECGCGPDDMCATCAPSDEAFADAIMAALAAEIRDQDAPPPPDPPDDGDAA